MSDIRKRLVVALGGNAISAPGKVGDIDEQFAQVSETAEVLCDAIERGYHLIVTHGNGPQVGNILRRVELARGELYPIPLEVCVADTQAGMGYMICRIARAVHPDFPLLRRGASRSAVRAATRAE